MKGKEVREDLEPGQTPKNQFEAGTFQAIMTR
jgi:hypothetical protein